MQHDLARNVLRLPAVLTLAAAVAAPWVGAAPAAKPEAGKATPAATAESKKLTPEQVSRDLMNKLKKDKMPWQFYQPYIQIYAGYAKEWEAKITDKTPEPTARQYQAMADYYNDICKALEAMGGNQKTMDLIRLNNSDVPFEQRADTFTKARDDHGALIAKLLEKLRNPPGKVKKN